MWNNSNCRILGRMAKGYLEMENCMCCKTGQWYWTRQCSDSTSQREEKSRGWMQWPRVQCPLVCLGTARGFPELTASKSFTPFLLGVLKAADKDVPSVWLHYPCSAPWGPQFLWLDQGVWNYLLAKARAKELSEVWRYGLLMCCLGAVGQPALYVLFFREEKRRIRVTSDH